MPSPATTAGGTAATQETNERQGALAAVPFIRASQIHREAGNVDKTTLMTAADQDLGVFEIPAYGYLAEIVLVVEATGGAAGLATVNAHEDAPFTAIKNIYLEEPNGAVIQQFKSGYDLFLANKFGGYRYQDPRLDPNFSDVATSGNFTYVLKLPVQLRGRDALGALPNQNSSAQFRLRMTLAASTAVYDTAPDTKPSVRVRAYLKAWDQPSDSAQGRLNNVTPPAVNTTQYWSSQEYPIVSGENTVTLKRVGNYIRNLLFLFRTTTDGTRSDADADVPDPLKIHYDARILDLVSRANWLTQIGDVYDLEAGTADTGGKRENGVFPYSFCHEFDGKAGYENNDLWLETLTSTRLELQGSWGEAGTLTVLTNDVSVAGNVFM